MMASCLSKLHSDPMFSITLISPLGPQTGSGAVPRTPATPRHSPPLRGRPRDALYYYYLALQQICCHAFLEEQAWCSMGSSSFLFQHVYPIRLLEAANFLRLINASMKEATAKRPLLKDFIELEIHDFPVPADSGRSPQPAVALQTNGFLKDFN